MPTFWAVEAKGKPLRAGKGFGKSREVLMFAIMLGLLRSKQWLFQDQGLALSLRSPPHLPHLQSCFSLDPAVPPSLSPLSARIRLSVIMLFAMPLDLNLLPRSHAAV